MSAAVKRYRIAGCGVLAPAGIHEYVYAQDHDEFAAQRHNEINAAYGMAIRKQAEIERLRVLLTECGAFIVTGTDEGCEPGACAECDMHRLRLRIDAALAGAAVQPSSPADGQPVAEGVARAEVVPYPYGEGRTDQPDAVLRDAERYRYMRNNASFRDRNGPGLYWYLPRFLPGGGAEQLDAAIDSQLRAADPTTVATAMKHGDYVLATKYDDGDPGDQFAVGHYDRFDCERHYVTDAEGKQFRGNGFRRCEPVTPYEGAWLIAHFPEFVPLELVERDDGEDYLAGKSVWDWLAEARATDPTEAAPCGCHYIGKGADFHVPRCPYATTDQQSVSKNTQDGE